MRSHSINGCWLAIVAAALTCAASTAGAQDSATARGAAGVHARARATPGDIAFIRGMIHHHAQAIEMSALIPTRTSRHELHLLGERITVSQRDEIAMMQQWLRDHVAQGADSLPAQAHAPAHAGHGAPAASDSLMPGMLSPAEMQALATASGNDFDRLFLEGMIKHHQGALTMVRALLAQPGAARQPQLYEFASDIDADQRAEIARMRALLATIPRS
ncbi:MAG: DUF305 domain-containing protein [Gemmatimonadaceae bacterium]|nr:DUF305 domain-containing protein [Gemmatimonadaceae bacterium]